jgi:hypothetical protein
VVVEAKQELMIDNMVVEAEEDNKTVGAVVHNNLVEVALVDNNLVGVALVDNNPVVVVAD